VASKERLERYDLVELVVMCQKLCDDASAHELIAREAARLKREWVVLCPDQEG
jgi:hypothetical protein